MLYRFKPWRMRRSSLRRSWTQRCMLFSRSYKSIAPQQGSLQMQLTRSVRKQMELSDNNLQHVLSFWEQPAFETNLAFMPRQFPTGMPLRRTPVTKLVTAPPSSITRPIGPQGGEMAAPEQRSRRSSSSLLYDHQDEFLRTAAGLTNNPRLGEVETRLQSNDSRSMSPPFAAVDSQTSMSGITTAATSEQPSVQQPGT